MQYKSCKKPNKFQNTSVNFTIMSFRIIVLRAHDIHVNIHHNMTKPFIPSL